MHNEALVFQIGIDMIPKIGSINAKRLIAYCGGIEAVFKQSKKALQKIPGVGEVLAHEISNNTVLDKAKREVEFVEKHRIKAFFYLDPEYPERLRQCEDCPIVLFVKGKEDVSLNQLKIISVVGTRSITDYGKEVCENIINSMAQKGHNTIIVSGLAYGVDLCAHKAALRNNLITVGVLGHGLDTIYPKIHRSIAKEIAQTGALVTDFPSETPIDPKNFIKRNRIIAGLADATLVIESGIEGGSLITADLAISYNREVLAIPGMVGHKYSLGCNALIKSNKAALVESIEDIEVQLNWDVPGAAKTPIQKALFHQLSPEEQVIVDVLSENGQEVIDVICFKTRMPVAKVSSILLNLEFAGVVKCKPGKLFSLTQKH